MPITAWYFIAKFSTFISYFHLSFLAVWKLIIFNNVEVTFYQDHLSIFVLCKMFTENLPLCKKLHENQMISTKHKILHLLKIFTVSTRVWAQAFSHFVNSSTACAFCCRLRDELTWCRLSSTWAYSVVSVIAVKILSN